MRYVQTSSEAELEAAPRGPVRSRGGPAAEVGPTRAPLSAPKAEADETSLLPSG